MGSFFAESSNLVSSKSGMAGRSCCSAHHARKVSALMIRTDTCAASFSKRWDRTTPHAPVVTVEDSSCEELADQCGDLLRMSFKREVASVEEMNGRTGNIAFERLGTGRQEERIVLSPCCKEAWLVRPKIILEHW